MTSSNEDWVWEAIKRDGSTQKEHDEAGEHGFGELRNADLSHVYLHPTASMPAHAVSVTRQGSRPNVFRRRRVEANQAGEELRRDTVHVLEVRLRSGESVYAFIFPTGSVLLTDDFQAV